MTLSFTCFLLLLLLQVFTLYFVVCLTCDLNRYDARLDRVGDTVNGLAHRVHMLQDGAEMAVRRLDDVTQAVKDMDGGLGAPGRQPGTTVVPGPDGYIAPRSQYPGTAPHVSFAEGGGHD